MKAHAAFPVLASLALLPLTSQAAEEAAPSKQLLQDLRGVWSAHFNHDASRVFVRMRDGKAGFWSVEEGTRVGSEAETQTATEASFESVDGKSAVIVNKDSVRVLEMATGRPLSPPLTVQMRESSPAVFTPDGETLITFEEKQASVWKVASGESVARIPLTPVTENDSADAKAAAVFTNDGAYCFIHDGLGTVTRYDAKTWQPAGKPMKHPPAESAYDFWFNLSEDGKWLATHDSPGENGPKANLQIWDAAASKPLGKPIVSVNGFGTHFLKGSNRILIGAARGTTTIRELPSLKSIFTLRKQDDLDEPSVSVSPDGKWILAWGPDNILNLYDATTPKHVDSLSKNAKVDQVIMAPDSSAAYIGFDNSAFLTEGHYDNYITRVSFPELKITHVARVFDHMKMSLSPDGRRLLAIQGGSDQEQIVIFDAATLKPLPAFGAE